MTFDDNTILTKNYYKIVILYNNKYIIFYRHKINIIITFKYPTRFSSVVFYNSFKKYQLYIYIFTRTSCVT